MKNKVLILVGKELCVSLNFDDVFSGSFLAFASLI